MNVAISGACGLLGAHLAAVFSAQHRVVGFDRHPWWGTRAIELHQGDLADAEARRRFVVDAAPDVFIHCAAMVNVDGCEDQPEEAHFVNGTLTGLLAREVPRSCTFVYITTDGIFYGDQPMRSETDLPCPRTVYGRSKLQGEWETMLHAPEHLIIRTNFFGWSSGSKTTGAEWVYEGLRNGHPLTLFDDFWFTPLYVTDLVQRILALLDRGARGVFHVAGGQRVSKLGFGTHMAEAAGFSMEAVSVGSIGDSALRADRPRDMSLDTAKTVHVTGLPSPSCVDGIQRFLPDRDRSLEERVAHLASP